MSKKKYSLEYNIKVRPKILLKEEIQVSLITQKELCGVYSLTCLKTNTLIKEKSVY